MKVALAPTGCDSRVVVVDAPQWEGPFLAFLETVQEAVTEWLDTTVDGQMARDEGKGVFTLADLAHYVPDCFVRGTSLGRCFVQRGIVFFQIEITGIEPDTAALGIGASTNLYRGEEA